MKSPIRVSKLRPAPPRYDRLEARVPSRLKRLFQEAADLRGVTLSDFIINCAHDAAVQTVERHKVIQLNHEASIQFASALLRPSESHPHRRAAARRYLEVTRSK